MKRLNSDAINGRFHGAYIKIRANITTECYLKIRSTINSQVIFHVHAETVSIIWNIIDNPIRIQISNNLERRFIWR